MSVDSEPQLPGADADDGDQSVRSHAAEAELLRLLEQRSIQSMQKVSPRKEVAERAWEQCPRRLLPRSNPGKMVTSRAASASRITPCALIILNSFFSVVS